MYASICRTLVALHEVNIQALKSCLKKKDERASVKDSSRCGSLVTNANQAKLTHMKENRSRRHFLQYRYISDLLQGLEKEAKRLLDEVQLIKEGEQEDEHKTHFGQMQQNLFGVRAADEFECFTPYTRDRRRRYESRMIHQPFFSWFTKD